MKRIITLLTFLLLAVMPLELRCQDLDTSPQPDLEQAIVTLQQDIEQLGQAISTYDDIEVYDYEFQEVGNRIRSLSITISKENPLYDSYDACNREFYQLQKRIEGLREEHSRQQVYEALMDRFQQSLQQLSSYKALGEQYVDKRMADSLMMVKKKAGNVYRKASMDASSQKDLVNNDAALSQLWDNIEEYNQAIESLECSSRSKLYEMLFRLVMVGLAVLMVFNMLQSKLKAKKMAKTAQKQMENLMGNNDTPVLCILALMALFVPSLHAQDLVLDYPKLSHDLDTVFVDFKLVENGQKLNLGTVDRSALHIEETGYNGNQELTFADVLDIRNYDPDYASGNYSIVVLVDRSVSEECLQAQRKALTELFQGFSKAKFYVTSMDGQRSPTITIHNAYQLVSWMDSCFSQPSSDPKFIYEAMASVLEEIAGGDVHDFYPELSYNPDLQDANKKVLLILTDGRYMTDDGSYIGGEEFFRIKTALINRRDNNKQVPVNFVYFGDDFRRDDFQKEIQYVFTKDDHFFPSYDFEAMKEYLVMRPDPHAMDYRMVLLNPMDKLYDGQKITLHVYYDQDGLEAYSFRHFTLGSLLQPQKVKVTKEELTGIWLRCIASGLILVLLLYLLFRIVIPRIKHSMFCKRYVKTFVKANTLPTRARDYVGQQCYYCKDNFQPGDQIVTKCEHTMHYECWKENGHQCPEYGKECTEGRFFYNEDHPWDKRNAPHYLKSLLVGLLVGLVSWVVFRGLADSPLFLPLIGDLVALSGKVGIDATGDAFTDKIHDLLFFCIVVGGLVALGASWLMEHRKKTPKRIMVILLRGFLGGLSGFVAGVIGAIVAIATGKDYNCFIVDVIPWVLMGALVGLTVTYKTHVSIKRGATWGCFFAFIGFCILYLFSFDDSNFSFQNIGLLANFLCMTGVMVFSGGLYAALATPDKVSERYFLHIEGTPKSRDVAVYKWMNRIGGYRVVTIGRSDRCYIDMDWDDTPGLDGVVAEVYMENDAPYYKMLATNQTKKLTHGTSFVIGRTVFTYLEKDLI